MLRPRLPNPNPNPNPIPNPNPNANPNNNNNNNQVCCALASAVVSVLCVNPVDVVRTRLYNAPPGRYSGGADAAAQLVALEGPYAFYKGALTHYLRLGPHMVLVFGILEQLKLLTG